MSSDTPRLYEAVGGHVSEIFRGPLSASGKDTLQKAKTTAWEILHYCAMALASQGGNAFPNGTHETEPYASFLRAVRHLREFTPSLFSIRFPADFQPRTTSLQAVLKQRDIDEVVREGAFIVVEGSNTGAALLWPLFVELLDGAMQLEDFDADYDEGNWGIGLVSLTSSIAAPTVMDVKVGLVRHSPLTPTKKVERMNAKESGSLMRSVGLRVCGFKKYSRPLTAPHAATLSAAEMMVETSSKKDGYAVSTEEELKCLLRLALAPGTAAYTVTADGASKVNVEGMSSMSATEAEICRTRAEQVSNKLQRLIDFFSASADGQYLMKEFAFVSSSVLLATDNAMWGGAADVFLIDFARSSLRRLNFDESTLGFLFGLRKMRSLLQMEAPSEE